MTNRELGQFMDYEGGLGASIKHGLESTEIDDELTRALWKIAAARHKEFTILEDAICKHLSANLEPCTEEEKQFDECED